MNIVIERAVKEDACALLQYLKQVGGETDNLSFGAEGLPIPEEAEREYIARLENSTDGILLVAKENGHIVGMASLERMPRRMRHRGELAISVLRSHWNAGIGTRLMGELLAFAKENGFSTVDLQVRSDNLAAIRLYEKFGFQKLCTYPGFFRVEGKPVDFDYMYLSL